MTGIKDRTFLAIGGAGFIGSHVVEVLCNLSPDSVVILDDFSTGSEQNLQDVTNTHSELAVVERDAARLSEVRDVVANHDIDVIFNLGVSPLPTSLTEPRRNYDNNVSITLACAELARSREVETLVQVSSSEVYGDAEKVPMDEDHPIDPKTPYAASKSASDQIVASYQTTFGIDATIIRPFNTYGPRQNTYQNASLIPATIENISNGISPVIHGDGTQTRDYIFVRDTAEAIVGAYQNEQTRNEVINVCAGQERSVEEIVSKIIDITGWEGGIEQVESRDADVERHLGDNSKAVEMGLLEDLTSFGEGLESTINWYSEWLGNNAHA